MGGNWGWCSFLLLVVECGSWRGVGWSVVSAVEEGLDLSIRRCVGVQWGRHQCFLFRPFSFLFLQSLLFSSFPPPLDVKCTHSLSVLLLLQYTYYASLKLEHLLMVVWGYQPRGFTTGEGTGVEVALGCSDSPVQPPPFWVTATCSAWEDFTSTNPRIVRGTILRKHRWR